MGCRPRARSVLRCHGVLVLRHGPPREHKQAGRWPMKGGQSPSLELVSREFRKQRLEPWAAGRGPDPSFAAMVFWCCDTVRQENTGKLAGGPMKGGQSPSLELVSREFRKQRLEPWAAACRPRARSVLRCHGVLVLRHGLGKVSKRTQASWQVADEGQAKSKFGASF